MKLSDKQLEIVNHKEGALLVMAGAGSGKTRVLTERIKKLLEEKDGNFHVLALTFTNKAAKEMKERLEDVKDIDKRSFIGTIHGFCQEVIEKHGYAIDLADVPQIFEKYEDRMSILIQVFKKRGNEDLLKFYVDKTPQEQEKFIYNALTYISLKKKNLKGIPEFNELDKDIQNGTIQKMYSEYNHLLKEQNAMDFDDVILKAYKIFAERSSIAKIYRKLYKYISIDEAQDLNLAQYELIKVLCNGDHKNVLMVGDSNQSLYHFNGSDKKFMENNFIVDFNAEIKRLDINYRSSKAVIEVANKIKPNSMEGFKTDINGEFDIIPLENEVLEAKWVVDKIQVLLKKGVYKEQNIEEEILEQNIAVLARNRYLFAHIEDELKKRNIKYYLKKNNEGLDIDSVFIRIFDLGLRILSNPFDQLHFVEIAKLLQISPELEEKTYKNGLEKLMSIKEFVSTDFIDAYIALISSWTILSDESKLRFREALKELEIYANTKLEVERLEILSDIKIYEELWSNYAKNTNSELKSLQHFKTQISLGLVSSTVDETGVTLSTIHLSKGLEFKVVFIIGMNQGSLPYYKAIQEKGKTLEEEKNIFYVAVTRAERVLYITYPKYRFMPWDTHNPKRQNPSVYLDNL